MSFSSDVKEELSKLNNYTQKDSIHMELLGFCITSNAAVVGQKIRFSTENQYNINRFAKLLTNSDILDYTIELQGRAFTIFFDRKDLPQELEVGADGKIGIREGSLEKYFAQKEEQYTKDFARGAFLGGGSINNPEKKYHLEMKFSQNKNKEEMQKRLQKQKLAFKELTTGPVLYIKDGEEISHFLAWCGASSGVLRFEEIRVMREVRNNVNRLVNCETANLNKTINSALKQIEDIKWIKQNHKFNELSKPLKEIAELRLRYPEKSLTELGELLPKQIGRSGVNHRFMAISKLAEELRNKEK